MKIRTAALLSLLALGLPACQHELANSSLTPYDAKVNVHAANSRSMQLLEVDVIKSLQAQYQASETPAFYLIRGSDYETYQKVGSQLGKSVKNPETVTGKEPVYAVRSVNLGEAEGDVVVIHPSADSPLVMADAHVVYSEVNGHSAWRVVKVTDRTVKVATIADMLAEERNTIRAAQEAAEKKVAEKAAAEKAAAEKKAAEKAAAEKAAAEKKAAEKAAAEKAAAEKKAAEKAAAEKVAAEKKAAEKAVAEKVAAEKKAAEKAVAEKAAAQKKVAEKAAAEKAAAEKKAAEKAVAEKAAAEKKVAEKAAAEKAAAEKKAAEKAPAEKPVEVPVKHEEKTESKPVEGSSEYKIYKQDAWYLRAKAAHDAKAAAAKHEVKPESAHK